MRLPLLSAFLLPVLLAQSSNGPTIPKLDDVNPELLNLVIYDQWDRGNDLFGDRRPSVDAKLDVAKRDEERRIAIRKLLADGKVQTAKDYRFAALILQHSPDSAGYMLAHVLAVTAVGKGDGSSKWLAAATLDRYLQSLNQPQVFGTQFRKADGVWTMDPYDRAAFSDAIRATWCVIPLAAQESIEKDALEGKPVRGTAIDGCK